MIAGQRTVDCSRLLSAVDRSFDAVVRPELWPAVFQDIADATASVGLIAFRFGAGDAGSFLCSPSIQGSLETYLREGWYERNPRLAKGEKLSSISRLVTDADLVTDVPDEDDRAWQADFLERQGLGWFVGTDLYSDGSNRIMVSLERSSRLDPFQRDELAVISLAFAHLRRSLTLAPQLDDAATKGLLTGLESTGQPAMLLDAGGRVIQCNALAERQIGQTILLRDGHLCVDDRDSNRRLQRFIASLVRPQGWHGGPPLESVVLSQAHGRPLVVRGAPIAPVGAALFRKAYAFVTFAVAGAAVGPDHTLLRETFGLTASEARVAIAIANDLDIRDVAASHGISMETVRSHLRSIFAKTDTRRQTSLAVLINSLQP